MEVGIQPSGTAAGLEDKSRLGSRNDPIQPATAHQNLKDNRPWNAVSPIEIPRPRTPSARWAPAAGAPEVLKGREVWPPLDKVGWSLLRINMEPRAIQKEIPLAFLAFGVPC